MNRKILSQLGDVEVQHLQPTKPDGRRHVLGVPPLLHPSENEKSQGLI